MTNYEISPALAGLGHGVFFGIIASMALLNLFFFYSQRDRSFLFYSLYQVFFALFIAGDRVLYTEFFHLSRSTNDLLAGLFLGPSICFFILFARQFLRTRELAPRLDKVLLGFVVYILLGVFLSPWFRHPVALLHRDFAAFVSPLVILAPGYIAYRRGLSLARFYLVAMSFFCFGPIVEVFTDLEVLPYTIIGDQAFQITAIFEALVLAAGLIVRMRDIESEKRRLEVDKALAESARDEAERRFHAVFDQAFSAIALLGVDGSVSEVNQAMEAASGLGRDTLRGRAFADTPFNRAGAGVALADALLRARGGESVRIEQTVENEPGRMRSFDMSVKPVLDATGRVSALTVEARDMTGLKEAEARMFQAEKLATLGRLVAGIAHEINNPNNFIHFNLPILEEYLDALMPVAKAYAEAHPDWRAANLTFEEFAEDAFKLLDNMKHGSERITHIVAELRGFVQQQGEGRLSPSSLQTAVNRAVTLTKKQVLKTVRTFDVELAKDLPSVAMDKGKIEQVLVNLLLNAAQAAKPEGAHVILSAARSSDNPKKVRVAVKDNGAGIARENLERIFEPFFTTKSSRGGTGLGLAVSFQIIEAHGGRLMVSSSPGAGAEFSFELDVSDEEAV